jgi:hypothetical protein
MSIELQIPIQPKTKVVARDLEEANSNKISQIKKA